MLGYPKFSVGPGVKGGELPRGEEEEEEEEEKKKGVNRADVGVNRGEAEGVVMMIMMMTMMTTIGHHVIAS